MLTFKAEVIILIIGTITMLTGAVKALNEWDIKRVLAYSTMSQLGLMVVAIGFGSWQTAMFHLATHAFFKAGLFLSAGSVIHAVTPSETDTAFDPQDMHTMGGLRKSLPITFLCFSVCAAALAGLPFFSGFLSKDAIITEGFFWAKLAGPVGYIFPLIVIFSAGLTAYYMTRQVWLVFFGEKRYTVSAAVHPHESPALMWLPMLLLSVLSLFIWFSWNPFDANGWFLHFLGPEHSAHLSWVPFVASATTFLFIFLAYRETKAANPFRLGSTKGQTETGKKFAFSWLRDYSRERYFIIPFEFVANTFKRFEKSFIDLVVDWIAKGSVVAAHVISWIDRNVVDGGVNLTVFSIRSAGNAARGLQNGRIQSYYLVTVAGLFFLILWLVLA